MTCGLLIVTRSASVNEKSQARDPQAASHAALMLGGSAIGPTPEGFRQVEGTRLLVWKPIHHSTENLRNPCIEVYMPETIFVNGRRYNRESRCRAASPFDEAAQSMATAPIGPEGQQQANSSTRGPRTRVAAREVSEQAASELCRRRIGPLV